MIFKWRHRQKISIASSIGENFKYLGIFPFYRSIPTRHACDHQISSLSTSSLGHLFLCSIEWKSSGCANSPNPWGDPLRSFRHGSVLTSEDLNRRLSSGCETCPAYRINRLNICLRLNCAVERSQKCKPNDSYLRNCGDSWVPGKICKSMEKFDRLSVILSPEI